MKQYNTELKIILDDIENYLSMRYTPDFMKYINENDKTYFLTSDLLDTVKQLKDKIFKLHKFIVINGEEKTEIYADTLQEVFDKILTSTDLKNIKIWRVY